SRRRIRARASPETRRSQTESHAARVFGQRAFAQSFVWCSPVLADFTERSPGRRLQARGLALGLPRILHAAKCAPCVGRRLRAEGFAKEHRKSLQLLDRQ